MVKPDFTAEIIITTPLRFWESDWRELNQFCPKLAQATSALSPLYCLPKPAIDSLARHRGRSLPILDSETAKAEIKFTELCLKHQAIGCWADRPITYPYLSQQPEWPDMQALQIPGWSAAQRLQIKNWQQTVEDSSLRLKGYAGWLLTEPAFLAEAEKLMSSWLRLPDSLRPPLPITRPVSLFKLPKKGSPQSLVKFSRASRKFLDRWGLVEMTTWELPMPQGPFLPNELPPGSPAVPAHGVHLVLPLHYPLQGDDGLLQQIQDLQRRFAREQGLDESLAGLPHYKAYASMLEVVHWEQVIRSRFRVDKRLPGLVTWIEEAIAGILRSGLAGVQKLHKAIRSCRKGQRARVTWLQPRKR